MKADVGQNAISGSELEKLKGLIIDQEAMLSFYSDQWELLYQDLASCIKIMMQIERKSESQE